MTPKPHTQTKTQAQSAAKLAPHATRMAKATRPRGHREVHALNTLEAHGYRRLAGLHAQGSDFVATAQKNGKSYRVTVTPSGTIRAVPA
jgi:hypothetical protein